MLRLLADVHDSNSTAINEQLPERPRGRPELATIASAAQVRLQRSLRTGRVDNPAQEHSGTGCSVSAYSRRCRASRSDVMVRLPHSTLRQGGIRPLWLPRRAAAFNPHTPTLRHGHASVAQAATAAQLQTLLPGECC